MAPLVGTAAPAGGEPAAASAPTVQLDAAQLSQLSAVFSAPRWLRDLGFAAWLMLGVAALGFALILLLDATSVIVSPVIAGFVVATVIRRLSPRSSGTVYPAALGALFALLGRRHRVLILILVLGGIVSQTTRSRARAPPRLTRCRAGCRTRASAHRGASDATGSLKTDVPDIISTLVSGITSGIEGLTSLAFAALVHAVLAVLPAQGRPGDASLGRASDGRATPRCAHHHRRRHPVAPPLLRRRHHRRGIQRDRGRHRGTGARCATCRHDRGGHLRHRLCPVHRRLRLRRLRRHPGARLRRAPTPH